MGGHHLCQHFLSCPQPPWSPATQRRRVVQLAWGGVSLTLPRWAAPGRSSWCKPRSLGPRGDCEAGAAVAGKQKAGAMGMMAREGQRGGLAEIPHCISSFFFFKKEGRIWTGEATIGYLKGPNWAIQFLCGLAGSARGGSGCLGPGLSPPSPLYFLFTVHPPIHPSAGLLAPSLLAWTTPLTDGFHPLQAAPIWGGGVGRCLRWKLS